MKSGRKKDEIFSETAKAYLFQVAGERLFNPTFLNDDGIFQDYIDQVSVGIRPRVSSPRAILSMMSRCMPRKSGYPQYVRSIS